MRRQHLAISLRSAGTRGIFVIWRNCSDISRPKQPAKRRQRVEVWSDDGCRGRPGRSGCLSGRRAGYRGLPVPRQQRLQLMRFGSPWDDAFQHVGQVRHRIDAVQLGRRPRLISKQTRNRLWVLSLPAGRARSVAEFFVPREGIALTEIFTLILSRKPKDLSFTVAVRQRGPQGLRCAHRSAGFDSCPYSALGCHTVSHKPCPQTRVSSLLCAPSDISTLRRHRGGYPPPLSGPIEDVNGSRYTYFPRVAADKNGGDRVPCHATVFWPRCG